MDKIAKIKQTFPIAQFVAQYTGGLKSSGNGFFMGRCPFHQQPEDNRRKFWVNPARGLCGCFVPRCQNEVGKPMDVINFYARLRGISNGDAVRELWERVNNGS